MRHAWLIVVLVVVPASVMAAPSVAIAPLDGDSKNAVGNAIAKVAEDEGMTVTGPKDTAKAMKKLGLEGELDSGDQQRLRGKLDVQVIIQGKVDGKTVELKIAGKGIRSSSARLHFKKKPTSPEFKGDVREMLSKKLALREEEDEKPTKRDDEDKPKKRDDEDKPTKRDDDVAETSEEDGEEVAVKKKHKKRKHRDDDEDGGEEAPRHVVTQAAIRANAGAGFARRGLTYDASGNQAPPSVGTAGASARIEVEAYPASFDTLKGAVAGLGIYGDFDRTFGVSIDVPGTTMSAAITQQHYQVGARYRLAFGQSTVAFGIGYAAREYVADRSGLGTTRLDMPDVNYKGVAPNVIGRFAITPTIGAFGAGTFLLMLDAGPIASSQNFGHGTIIAFEAAAGVDVAFTRNYGLKAALEASQVGISFDTAMRGVSKATDRTIGITASFEILY